MGRMRSHLLVTLGFAFAGAIGAAFGTGTAQAVVASLVEIVNPASSPVPTSSVDATDPGRIAYQSQLSGGTESGLSGGQSCTGLPCCQISFPVVTAGHRLVIEQVNVVPGFSQTPQRPIVTLIQQDSSGRQTAIYLTFSPPATPAQAYLQPALVYVDPGDAVSVQVCDETGAGTFTSGIVSVTLTGYELDCTAAACSPIATQ